MPYNDIDLFSYLPCVFRKVREFKEIFNTAEEEINILKEEISRCLDNQFIKSADIGGVDRLEKAYNLNLAGMDTEDKRFEITLKLNEQGPYTVKILGDKLSHLCTEEGYTLEADPHKKTLTVYVALSQKENFNSVKRMLERIVPADMKIYLSLMYNQNKLFKNRTYGELKAFTHSQLRNEVMNNELYG